MPRVNYQILSRQGDITILSKVIFFSAFLVLFLISPIFKANGQVVINEIAWMGTSDSPSNEWVELYNQSTESVDLSLWIIRIENVKDVILSGSISGNSYFLIERTDDETVPEKQADLIATFGHGIPNSGGNLILLDQSQNEIDRVIGGENWQNIGGDNVSKHSAQRTAAGWITAYPTPKTANTIPTTAPAEANNTPQNQNTPPAQMTQYISTGSSQVPDSQTQTLQITASAGGNRSAPAGTPIVFEGKATGFQGKPLPDARYIWSLGDGARSEQKSLEHSFTYPGKYTVSLTVSSGEWNDTDRILVEVFEPQVTIESAEADISGFVLLKNSSKYETDISKWSIVAGESSFYFPQNTIMAPNTEVRFPNKTTGLFWHPGEDVYLRLPNLIAVSTLENKEATPQKPAGENSSPSVQTNPPQNTYSAKKSTAIKTTRPAYTENKESTHEDPAINSVSENNLASLGNIKGQDAAKNSEISVWLFYLCGLILLSIGAYYLVPKKNNTFAEEYEIIEENDEQ